MELREGASGRKLARRAEPRQKKRDGVKREWMNRYQRCSDPKRSVIRLNRALTGDLDHVASRTEFQRQFKPELLPKVGYKSENGRLV